MDISKYIKINEAAQILSVTPSRIRQLIGENKLTGSPVPGINLLLKEEVESLLKKRNEKVINVNFKKHKICNCQVCEQCSNFCEICKREAIFVDLETETKYYCLNHIYLHDVVFRKNDKLTVIYKCCGNMETLEEDNIFECFCEKSKDVMVPSDAFVRVREKAIDNTERRDYYKNGKEKPKSKELAYESVKSLIPMYESIISEQKENKKEDINE